jgi:hypothetical protein
MIIEPKPFTRSLQHPYRELRAIQLRGLKTWKKTLEKNLGKKTPAGAGAFHY